MIRLALGNIHGVIVFALFICVLGSVAIVSIPVDILPAFKIPAVQVLTYYNGMPARSTERTLTDRIERWVNQSPGVAAVESRSVSGVSVVAHSAKAGMGNSFARSRSGNWATIRPINSWHDRWR